MPSDRILPPTMRSALCPAAGRFELRETPLSALVGTDVLVRVAACGICGSDLHYFQGGFPPPSVCPGHEIAGEIVAVGPQASVAVGTRVAVEPLLPCGRCSYCQTGNYQVCPAFCIVGNRADGGFADYVRVPERAVFALPESIDFTLATLTEPLAVAVHALRLARPEPGDRILVLGAGTIGLLAVAAARAAGAGEIWITARHPHQQQAAERLGADRVFTSAPGGELRSAARRDAIDVVVETVGGEATTLAEAITLVRPRGTVVVLGLFTAPVAIDAATLVVKEVRLLGSMTYGRSGARADFDRALDLLVRQSAALRALLTHRFDLPEIEAAFRTAADKTSGAIKVTVVPAAAELHPQRAGM